MNVKYPISGKRNPVTIPRQVAALLLLIVMTATQSVMAQSSSGLKLGEPEQPATTLDLGAPAPADRTDAPAPAAAPAAAPQPTAPAGPVSADSITREKVGAWDVACQSGGSNCAMAQVGNDSSGTPVLEMVVRKLEEPLEVGDRTAIAVLDVITPLGVVLTENLSVSIDGSRPESAPFQVCTEQGCLVREPIDSDLIDRFKRGNAAVISVTAMNQGEVKASLSLSGFTKAFNGLK